MRGTVVEQRSHNQKKRMITKTDLTLEEFWALPEGKTAYELVDGKALASGTEIWIDGAEFPLKA